MSPKLTPEECEVILARRRAGEAAVDIAAHINRDVRTIVRLLRREGLMHRALPDVPLPGSHPAIVEAPFIRAPTLAQLMAGR